MTELKLSIKFHKMIFILSCFGDYSTEHTIDWLKTPFIRINKENKITKIDLSIKNNQATIFVVFDDKIEMNLQNLSAYWYRRDDFVLQVGLSNSVYKKSIKKNIESEWRALKAFLHFACQNDKILGSFDEEMFENKLISLFVATQFKISVPISSVTNLKSSLSFFYEEYNPCITKSLKNILEIQTHSFRQTIGTNEVDTSNLKLLGNKFFPIFIQKKVEKIFELRIFYIHKQFYTMAIFSQNDEQTKLDYRNYNREKPNRNIPYILPEDIKDKLQLLMNKLNLNTGSIDMIVTPEGDYVFLEVNPTGQFGWVSYNCNYYLEEKIANHLQGA
jgi:ATP-GRASP peptide maturase of grasp-with-spasm system